MVQTLKNGGLSPKIEPLPGSLQAERKRCGRDNCHCATGLGHGPYRRRYWRENGRRYRQYVKPDDVEAVEAALAEWRRLHPPVWSARCSLAKLRRLLRELTDPGR